MAPENQQRSFGEDRGEFERARLSLARMQVSGGNSLKEVFERTTETAATTLQVERVGIWLFLHDRRAIRCYDLYERSMQEHSEGAILYSADFPTYFRTLEERRDIPAVESRTNPVTHELREAYLEPLGITSMLDAPIFRAGQVIGVVCHEQVGPSREWTVEERDFAGSVADAIALKLESAARQDVELSRRALEAHLAEIHKMEAVSRMAASVVHDFKNILLVILGNAELISRASAATPEIIERARQILDSIERGKALSEELLNYGRDQSHRTSVINVAEIVQRLIGSLQTAVGRAHSIHFSRGPSPGRVFMERSQLERVLLNLCLNARDAMPPGGIIRITVNEVRVTEGLGAPGVYMVLEVSDTGVGMDAGTRGRIFEPFFTTKPEGKGSGLGLAIVYRIVDRAGGFVHVSSEPAQGTSVRVYLPRVSSET